LKRLGIWDALNGLSEPIRGIRIVDSGEGLLRAPEALFEAQDAGFEAFGYNIPNATLIDALEDINAPLLVRRRVAAGRIDIADDFVTVIPTDGQEITARLVVAADGRNSACRIAARIDVSSWTYPQSAIVTTFSHRRSHRNISTELHRPVGPLTVVPGRGNTSHLVWIDAHEEIARVGALDDQEFGRELGASLRGLLGSLADFAPRQAFPISGQSARSLAKDRVVLVGEAAHVIPPIGAQGLNLSFRDAATLAEIAGDAKRDGIDIGGDETLRRYRNARRLDVGTRVFAVDLLNRSLLSNLPGMGLARGLGLFALASLPAFRARVMREGILPAASSPALMNADDHGGKM
jgi:2-octaprenyl-6-methoxyphenol hydroxylase